MATFDEMLQRFEMVRDNIIGITGQAMLEEREPLVGLLVHQQYYENIDSQGDPLRAYFPAYRHSKELAGKSGKTDFEVTGEMHSTMYLRVDGDEFEFNSPAQTEKGELKTEWLNNWNGSETMMLAPDNIIVAQNIVHPVLVQKIAALTGCE